VYSKQIDDEQFDAYKRYIK